MNVTCHTSSITTATAPALAVPGVLLSVAGRVRGYETGWSPPLALPLLSFGSVEACVLEKDGGGMPTSLKADNAPCVPDGN